MVDSPFAMSLTRQAAGKAPSHKGCGKIERDREGRNSVFQSKMRPRSGLWAPMYTLARFGIPAAARSPLCGAPRATLWGAWRCAPWHRSPGYDLRRAPYDHPDFTSNALREAYLGLP